MLMMRATIYEMKQPLNVMLLITPTCPVRSLLRVQRCNYIILLTLPSTRRQERSMSLLQSRARIFGHFMCTEKTSGLIKTYDSLWSPSVRLNFLSVVLPLCLSHQIIRWYVFQNNFKVFYYFYCFKI
jgi:hypothetical protein